MKGTVMRWVSSCAIVLMGCGAVSDRCVDSGGHSSVVAETDPVDLVSAFAFTCALRRGSVYCWPRPGAESNAPWFAFADPAAVELLRVNPDGIFVRRVDGTPCRSGWDRDERCIDLPDGLRRRPLLVAEHALCVVVEDSVACGPLVNPWTSLTTPLPGGALAVDPRSTRILRGDGRQEVALPLADGLRSVPDGPLALGSVRLRGDGMYWCGIWPVGRVGCWIQGEVLDVPHPVEGVTDVVELDLHGSTAVGLTAEGEVYAWTVSRGATEIRASRVPLDERAAHVAAPDGAACAISATGRVWCWGSNELGQLGVPDVTAASAPVELSFDP